MRPPFSSGAKGDEEMSDVKCVKHTHEEKKTTTWCGRMFNVMEFNFVSLDHAAYANQGGSTTLPCARCIAAAVAALEGRGGGE